MISLNLLFFSFDKSADAEEGRARWFPAPVSFLAGEGFSLSLKAA
jgi:hypothetical protein